jgi:hypothetical protein
MNIELPESISCPPLKYSSCLLGVSHFSGEEKQVHAGKIGC